MDWMELLQQIFELCVIPLLGIVTAYVVTFIKAKTQEITAGNSNELLNKYINMLAQTVCDCVITTNQTYVDALKGQNAFDKEAQEKAFEMTYNAVLDILSDDAKDYLTTAYGDLGLLIKSMIESEVCRSKSIR